MQDAATLLSEDDLALIHALQLRPRASWTDLGRVLGVDPATASRRYARPSRRGEAWVSLSPGRRMLDRLCIAFVDVECAAGAASEVARALVRHRHMVTVERVADGHEILATVATQDLARIRPIGRLSTRIASSSWGQLSVSATAIPESA